MIDTHGRMVTVIPNSLSLCFTVAEKKYTFCPQDLSFETSMSLALLGHFCHRDTMKLNEYRYIPNP